MAAFVEHSFDGGFMLDEACLRKLKDIIETRQAKTNGFPKLKYRVYRGDSYSYETEAVDDVVNEDNADWRRIKRLELHLGDNQELRFRLSFSNEGCDLRITGADRDAVFLLFSDIRDYVHNEIMTAHTLSEKNAKIISTAVGTTIMAATLLVPLHFLNALSRHNPELLQNALSNHDAAAKLDYLIRETARPIEFGRWPYLSLPLLVIALSLVSSNSLQSLLTSIFPGNQFLFGKRKQISEKRQRLVSNVLWVVVVGSVVSVLGGLAVWYLTRPH